MTIQVEFRWSGEGTSPWCPRDVFMSWPLGLPLPKAGEMLDVMLRSLNGDETIIPLLVERTSAGICIPTFDYGCPDCHAVIWLVPAAQRR